MTADAQHCTDDHSYQTGTADMAFTFTCQRIPSHKRSLSLTHISLLFLRTAEPFAQHKIDWPRQSFSLHAELTLASRCSRKQVYQFFRFISKAKFNGPPTDISISTVRTGIFSTNMTCLKKFDDLTLNATICSFKCVVHEL